MNWGRAARRRWGLWAAAAVLLILAGWWWVWVDPGSGPPDNAATSRGTERDAALAPVIAQPPVPPQSGASSAAHSASGTAAPASAAVASTGAADSSASSAAAGAGFWDLCGIGRVPWPAGTDAARPTLPEHLGKAEFIAGAMRLFRALEAGDERSRAAGRFFVLNLVHNLAPNIADPSWLLQVTQGTRDPVVAAWAAAACAYRPACAAATAREWAALDPDNGLAWALLHHQSRGSYENLLPALQAANRWSDYWGTLANTVMRHMPTDLPGYVQVDLLQQAINQDFVVQMSIATHSALDICRTPGAAASAPPLVQGSARQRACDRVARLSVDHAETLWGLYIGTRAAELAGWPAPAVQALRADRQVLEQMMRVPPGVDPNQPWSCAALQSIRQEFDDIGRLGELGMLRARAASSPAPGR